MRPKVDYESKERLIAVARDVDEGLKGRSVSFQEALNVLLDYVESTDGKRAEELEPEFTLGESGRSQGGHDGIL